MWGPASGQKMESSILVGISNKNGAPPDKIWPQILASTFADLWPITLCKPSDHMTTQFNQQTNTTMNLDEEPDDGNVCYYTGIEGEITQDVTVVWSKVKWGQLGIRLLIIVQVWGLFISTLDLIWFLCSHFAGAGHYNSSIYPATSGWLKRGHLRNAKG